MNYKDLGIWKLANEVSIEIHNMTLLLPDFEKYEIGSQIRRSSKSVKSNIVEGYGRKNYKADLLKFLRYSLASNDETLDHLDTLFLTQSLKDSELFNSLKTKIIKLGKMLINFIKSVIKNHNSFYERK
jgi:four helix bundle protein